MSEELIIISIIAGIIFVGIAIKFWRVIVGMGVVGTLAAGFLCLQGEIDCPFGRNRQTPSLPIGHTSLQWSRTDLIYSVYQHLKGKQYSAHQSNTRSERVPCTQDDYETDWAKGDPYAGKCRGEGGYGHGYKTVVRRENRKFMKRCPDPPPVNSSSWSVQKTGHDSWIVSNPQGRWTVKKVGESLKISAHQKC